MNFSKGEGEQEGQEGAGHARMHFTRLRRVFNVLTRHRLTCQLPHHALTPPPDPLSPSLFDFMWIANGLSAVKGGEGLSAMTCSS